MFSDSRDFIYATKMFQIDEKTCTIIAKSIDYDYPLPKKTVRGEISMSGIILTALGEDKTNMIYVISLDPKGKIPEDIKKWMAKS